MRALFNKILLFLFLSHCAVASAFGNSLLKSGIYEVKINESWIFASSVFIADEFICIAVENFEEKLLKVIKKDRFTSLDNTECLKVDNKFIKELDESKLQINIYLEQDYFNDSNVKIGSDDIDLDGRPIKALNVNYNLNLNDKIFSSLLDINYFSDSNWKLSSSILFKDDEFIRLNSSVGVRLNNGILQAGDINSVSGDFIGGMSYFGLNYSTPYFNLLNLGVNKNLELKGFSIVPSALDVYFDGINIQKENLESGKYVFLTPAPTVGYGELTSYSKDVQNNVVSTIIPFYINNNILKEKQLEYNIGGGVIRENYGVESFDYGSAIINGVFKYGVSDKYTQDVYFQGSSDYSNMTVKGHILPYPSLGVFNVGASVNSLGQGSVNLGYERIAKTISVGFDYKKSEGFCVGFDQYCLKDELRYYAGLGLPVGFGRLNLVVNERSTDRGNDSVKSLQYNNFLFKNVSLYSNISLSERDEIKDEMFFVGFSFNIDGINANTSVTRQNDTTLFQDQISFSKTDKYNDFTYYNIADNRADGFNSYSMSLGKTNNDYSLNMNVFNDKSGTNINANFDGSINYVVEDGKLFFNNRNHNGLIYLKSNESEGADVFYENNQIGKFAEDNTFLIVNAPLLSSGKVSLDPDKISFDKTVDDFEKRYKLPYSGAIEVEFKTKEIKNSTIYIKGIKEGSIFRINENIYVIGEGGVVTVSDFGLVKIISPEKVCELNLTEEINTYNCD